MGIRVITYCNVKFRSDTVENRASYRPETRGQNYEALGRCRRRDNIVLVAYKGRTDLFFPRFVLNKNENRRRIDDHWQKP